MRQVKKIIKLKAVTLIEVLMAIAIFAVGVLSLSYLIINNIGLSQRTKLKTTATMLAKE
jgi:prepilin-type N-terminal cleavage/methylation domain-containing protein